MEDWEKIEATAEATTSHEDVRILAGVPKLDVHYGRSACSKSRAKSFARSLAQFMLYMHGGVGFSPYRATFDALIPDVKELPEDALFGDLQRL